MSSSSHSATISTASHKPACYMGETANNLLTRGRINLYPSPKEYTQYKHLLEELLTEEFGSEHFEVEGGKDETGKILFVNTSTHVVAPAVSSSTHSKYAAGTSYDDDDDDLKDDVKEELTRALKKHGLKLEK